MGSSTKEGGLLIILSDCCRLPHESCRRIPFPIALRFVECHKGAKVVLSETQFLSGEGNSAESCSTIELCNGLDRGTGILPPFLDTLDEFKGRRSG